MSTPIRNTAPYLRVQRLFPSYNPQALSVEVDRAYIDIAGAVNARTIGVFSINVQSVNGESWFLQGGNRRQQGLRQIYLFSGAGNIPHMLNLNSISQFTKCSGSFTDGTNWYGAMFGSNVAIAGQVSFYITPTNIVVLSGAGAPSINSGTIVLEWISNT